MKSPHKYYEEDGGEDNPRYGRDAIMPRFGRAVHHVTQQEVRQTFVLVCRGDDPVEDFFIESPDSEDDPDPVAWIARGICSDGSFQLGHFDLSSDRFVSDVLSDGLDDQIRSAMRSSR